VAPALVALPAGRIRHLSQPETCCDRTEGSRARADPWERGNPQPQSPSAPPRGPQSRQKSYGTARLSGTVRTVVRCRMAQGDCAMRSAEYFRRQSDICLRLSLISSSEEVANRLIVMARDYQAKVDALEAESKKSPPPTIIAHRERAPYRSRDNPRHGTCT
jgi:hypothetical protein